MLTVVKTNKAVELRLTFVLVNDCVFAFKGIVELF